jgi:Fic family protein
MSSVNEKIILEFIKQYPSCSSMEVHNGLGLGIGYSTTKRVLTKLLNEKLVVTSGRGKGTKYSLSPIYELLTPTDLDKYFEKEIDERSINNTFNFNVFAMLLKADLFTSDETNLLNQLQRTYEANISKLSETEYLKELERLAIDLSWKSSQIEGNTYSLLETERLLKEKETASGKTKDEAEMLLNHKSALDFIIANSDYVSPLTLAKIENIHSILIKELGIDRNIRKHRVGISGTNYTPLDNDFQIKETLIAMCELVNQKRNVFEKALLILVLISYIQPFADGNKRTARIISNAILINHQHCPISFRTVDSIDYKKAMLVFYEQNNISAFKKIFIEQFDFAVKTYF